MGGNVTQRVAQDTWMNAFFSRVCVSLVQTHFYLFPWHKQAYMEIMNRL